MSAKQITAWGGVYRLFVAATAMSLCVFIGCGNMEGGCDVTGTSNGNDNSTMNVNENDNSPDNTNDNGPAGNENDNDNGTTNENDNTGGGNDNSGGGNVNDNQSGGNTNDNGSNNVNDNAVSNDNDNDNTSGNENDNTSGNENNNDNVNDNSTSNTNDNGGGGGNGNSNSGPATVTTKSSGAAKPGEMVTIGLGDGEVATLPQACINAAVWTQADSDAIRVTDLPTMAMADGEATFTAPLRCCNEGEDPEEDDCAEAPNCISETVSLNFNVSIPAGGECTASEGSIAVPIQVATIGSFDLPATVQVGVEIDLTTFLTVLDGAPAGRLELFFPQDPPPVGVDIDIEQLTGLMTVNTGVGQNLTITVRIIGTAGELAVASDTVAIVAAQQ